jgi:phosphoesterase RecJ-like protein
VNTFSQIWSRIIQAQHIILATHRGPDGDSYGSCVALARLIELNTTARATIICQDTLPANIREQNLYPVQEETSLTSVSGDLLILPDHGSPSAFVPYPAIPTISLDHHDVNTIPATLKYVNAKKIANCCVILDLIRDQKLKVDAVCAQALLLGICTDSGFFRHCDDMASVCADVEFCLAHGATYSARWVHSLSRMTFEQKRFFGHIYSMLQKKGNVMYGLVTKESLETFGLSWQDARFIVNSLNDVAGCDIIFCLIETPDAIKCSFRSPATYNVAQVAQTFGGGGHLYAAACQFSHKDYTMKTALARILSTLEDAKKVTKAKK